MNFFITQCKCGKTIAACVAEYADEEWLESAKEYVKNGYTVTSYTTAGGVNLERCSCDKKD